MSKVFTVTADVHKPIGNGYRVKVSLLDLGVYINGMVVYPPNDDHNDWSVMTPALRSGRGKWAHVIEFNKSTALWEDVYTACVQATKQHISELDVAPLDIPDGPIDFSGIDIPFK
jgi:hypothetical protein